MKDGTFTTDRLLALYDQVAEAEDAIPRLRRFVLDLAVRGKLVEQDPSDEPAAELLKRIAKEKARLVKAGEIGSQKPTTSLDPDDLPFALPSGWAWAQLSIVGIVSPRVRSEDAAEVSFVPMSMIAAELGVPHSHEVRVWRDVKKGYTTFAEGDVALAKITPCFENGKSTVFRDLTGGLGAGTTELHVVRPILSDPDFILLFLKSPVFIERGIPRMTGTAGQKRVPTEYFAASAFPLPPLAEQQRIVAKVEELMALCDRLQAARAGREAVRDRLTAATWARLTAPEADAETFPTHARAALKTLPTLTTRPDQIKTLRQTILNLAVRGKLVAQDPTDEPAAELLKRIAKERNAATKAKTVRRNGNQDLVSLSAERYLPESWVWTDLDQIALSMRYGTSIKCEHATKGVPVLRIPNVSGGVVTLGDMKYGPLSPSEIEDLALRAGDILMIRSNGSLDIVGRSAVVPAEADGMAFAGYLVRLRLSQSLIDPTYIWLVLNSSEIREQIERPIRSAVGLKNINLTEFGNLTIPLPPLAEQHRIVAKVDTLMALCDQLEASLTTATTTRSRLLEALLHEALGGAPSDQTEAAA
jgi:type I restriction enzyme S subunit